jgi:phosphohistidine phosphatase SixA
MGERLATRDVKLDVILTSPALRAVATAESIVKHPVLRKNSILAIWGEYKRESHGMMSA